MEKGCVLVTGANGFIGLSVIIQALKSGYPVRAVVRSQEKADTIFQNAAIKALKAGTNLATAVVPDFTADGAYESALKGVTYAVHIASPLPRDDTPGQGKDDLVEPAVQGTLNLLKSASKVQELKKVVITSSVSAQMSHDDAHVNETGEIYNEKSRTSDLKGPYKHSLEGYFASKIAALNAAEAWMNEQKPHFSLVLIHPSIVSGRDETVSTVQELLERSTARMILFPLVGVSVPVKVASNSVSIDDVACAHIRALDDDIVNGQSLVLTSGGRDGVTWNDAKEIAARHFPEAVKSGAVRNDGNIDTKITMYDYSESERVLGWTFKDFEQQVIDGVKYYLELVEKMAQ